MYFDTFFAIFSLYLNIRGLRKGPGKFFMGSWKSPGFFLSLKEWEPFCAFSLLLLGFWLLFITVMCGDVEYMIIDVCVMENKMANNSCSCSISFSSSS